jgi:hypothetical protein
MPVTTVYRIQPTGLEIAGHQSECSDGSLDAGVHVFLSLADLAQGVRGWVADDTQPELLTILCDDDDLEDNEDYEGMTLLDGAGTIVERRTFGDWDELHAWAADYEDHD